MSWIIPVLFTLLVFLTNSINASNDYLRFSLYRKHKSERLRQLSENEGFKEIAKIKREPDGVYWSDLLIGNPPQMFSVIVDTGSSTIAVPCKGCDCGEHHHYDPAVGGGQTLSSRYTQCYSEGSCNSGNFVLSKMCLGDSCDVETMGVNHKFGCCSKFANAFKKQEADGIIGMSGSTQTLIADLRLHHKLEKDMFSLCLSSSIGELGVGGYDPTRHLEPLRWTPLKNSRDFYKVTVNSIHLNGQKVMTGQLPIPIVDSGTTFTYVPANAHSAIRKSFDNFCNSDPSHCPGEKNPKSALSQDIRDSIVCYSPPSEFIGKDLTPWLEKFPPIEFEYAPMTGQPPIKTCIPSSIYFFQSAKNAYCVGLLKERSRFVIGAVTMAGFDIIFDHENNKLGMARSVCNAATPMDDIVRKSPAHCCGSCQVSQANGYQPPTEQEHTKPTPKPTNSPITPKPTLSISPPSTPTTPTQTSGGTPATPTVSTGGSGYTPDGNFFVKMEDGIEVLTPVDGKPWQTTNFHFTDTQRLLIDKSAKICADSDVEWTFAENAEIVFEGHETIIHLGGYCQYASITIGGGATVITFPDLDDDDTVRRRRLQNLDDDRKLQIRPIADGDVIVINEGLEIEKGLLVVETDTTLAFADDLEIDISRNAAIEIKKGGEIVCAAEGEGHGITFPAGHITFHGGSKNFCFTKIGQFGQITLIPSDEGEPVNFVSGLVVSGKMEVVILRQPFVTFALLSNATVSFDMKRPAIAELDFVLDNSGDIIRDLPEKSRIFAFSEDLHHGGFVDIPRTITMPKEFECSNVTIGARTQEFIFTSQLCLNKCISEIGAKCSAAEMEFYPWPPLPPLFKNPNDDDDDDDNSTSIRDIWDKYVQEYIPGGSPEVQNSIAVGTSLGIISAIILFIIIYPPFFLKPCCGCCRRYDKHGYNKRTYDSL